MIKEEEILVLKDICSRLYCNTITNLVVQWNQENYNIIAIGFGRVTLVKPFMSKTSGSPLISEIRPYLRPLSDMTEKEKDEIQQLDPCISLDIDKFDEYIHIANFEQLDYLNKHYLDYRGLIPRGLAKIAPKGMYQFN